MRDLLLGDLLAVDLQHAGAALAEAGAVVGEVEDDRVLARRQRLLPSQRNARRSSEVVE